jgi:hypothetical protein
VVSSRILLKRGSPHHRETRNVPPPTHKGSPERAGTSKVRVRESEISSARRGRITEAFPWNEAPRYLIRDRDRVSLS